MAVQPDGEVRLIPNVALDPRYEHTIWFDTKEEQAEYFIDKSTKSFTSVSYQRVGLGVLKLQAIYTTVDQMNYMMFRNTTYDAKWFYAFITAVDYINENTVQIHYELDVMQTWMFNYTMNRCFVEREHSATDVAGDNIVHEDVYFGEYIYTSPTHPSVDGVTMNDLSIVIAYNEGVFDIYGKVIEANEELGSVMTRWKNMYIGGTYYGISFVAMPLTSDIVSELDGLLSNIELWNTIICSFVMPTMFLPPERRFNDYNVRATMSIPRNTDFDGYVPKNNKLFTYPYTCAYITSFRGQGNEFYFEHFAPKGTATFNVEGALSLQPSVFCYPTNYKKMKSFLEGAVSIASYPVCTWGEDGLTEWINNNLFKSMLNIGIAGVGAAVAPATTVIPALTHGVVTAKDVYMAGLKGSADKRMTYAGNEVASQAVQEGIGMARAEFDPGTVHGSASSDLLMGTDYGRRIMGFCKHITYQYARIVDEYFSMYGYAVKRVKQPARNNRPSWNYVKTRGCTIQGYLPSSDMVAICAIYDKGVTFWNKAVNVGDYSANNNL